MSDDCSNKWGCCLSVLGKKRNDNGQTIQGGDDFSDFTKLRNVINCSLKNLYQLQKVLGCGSDANMYAVLSVTCGDQNRCLIAAGSYVAGDGGPLQSWSTSYLHLQKGISSVIPPAETKKSFALKHTIGLPYAIPGSVSETFLNDYEDRCFIALHHRCLVAKLKGAPIVCILLELMLASNGAALSDRALAIMGKLAEVHNLHFVVDEIMTGGRTGTMLLLETKPIEFTKRVSHVTLGKWLGAGLVLVSKYYLDLPKEDYDNATVRGQSTFIKSAEVILRWNSVQKNVLHAHRRREMVLKKLKIEPDEAWGLGVLVFAPINKKGIVYGLKNRLLPMLDLDLPIDHFGVEKMADWSKNSINNQTVEGVEGWLDFYDDESDLQIYKLVKFLTSCKAGEQLEMTTVRKEKFPNLTEKSFTLLLRQAEQAGLVFYRSNVGATRLRRWEISTNPVLFINNNNNKKQKKT